MKSVSIGVFGLLCGLSIGCQTKPLMLRNPFAATKRPSEDAIVDAQDDVRAKADELKQRPFATRTPDDRGVAEMKPIPESTDLIDDPHRDDPGQVEQMWSQAEAALQQGNLAKATAFYREVVVRDPNNAAAHHRLALIATQQKNYKLAESHYLQAANLAPQDTSVLNDLGYSYLEQGRLADSERVFLHLLQVDPGNSLALRNMGELKARQGHKADAFEYYRKGGFDYETAERKVIETAGPGPETGIATRRNANASERGLPYSSPTPDWDSRYGVAPVAENREPAVAASETGEVPAPAADSVPRQAYGNSAIRQTAAVVQPQAPSEPRAAGSGEDAYALERALLNAGSGSLFPVTPPRTTDERIDPDPRGGTNIAPVGYEAASPASGMNSYSTSANQPASVRIQSPASENASYGASPYAIPLTRDGQPSAAPESAGGYRQFPGRDSTTDRSTSDPLHQFEQEVQSDRYGVESRYP